MPIRQDLTDEWERRGIEEKKEYAILTNEISNATFGVPIKKHKQIKGLDPKFKNQNLRDHMTDLELIFTMLGEASTTEITKSNASEGFIECLESSREGGKIAGNARRELESKTGRKVVSSDNYLEIAGKVKKIENNSKSNVQKKKLKVSLCTQSTVIVSSTATLPKWHHLRSTEGAFRSFK